MRRATLLPLLLVCLMLPLLLIPGASRGYFPTPVKDQPVWNGDATLLGGDFSAATVNELIGGKLTLVFFFLPTCSHCIDAAPGVRKLAEKYGDRVQFLGIASGRSRLSEMREFVEQFGLPFKVVQDSSQVFAQKNGITGTPTFFLTDGQAVPTERFVSYSIETSELLEVAMLRRLGKDPMTVLDPTRYHGSMVCGSCHREEYISWSLNHHSVAMNSLVKTKQHEDPACVSCHVVGFGKPTGYVNLETSAHLAQVGCESCHGMAGGHNQKLSVEEKLKQNAQTVDQKYKDTCVACHDARHTIGFDFAAGVKLVGHKQDRNLTEVNWLAKRTQLVKGEVEKPLLAFPPGKIQGSEACAGCHAPIHKGWKSDPHGMAMETLKKAGKATDVSCVPCHGTLADKSRAQDVAAYQPGVGCESCHGPGEAHVKAGGGKGNIVALTESCPVCVIDAICSSCHNAANDADFKLEEALAKVRAGHKTGMKAFGKTP